MATDKTHDMFTVILLSASAKKIFNGSRDYFKPFEENGMVAFCDWVQSDDSVRDRRAETLYRVLPNLPDVIRGKDQWRAVVVDHVRGHAEEQGRDKQNPFDFLDNESTDLALEPSPHSLVRLAHVLLGYPHLPAKDFLAHYVAKDEDGVEQVVSGDPRTPGVPPVDIAAFNNVRRAFTEVEHTAEDKERHSELVERYRMKEVQPSEVVFISTRDSVEADETSGLRRAWRVVDQDFVTDRFVERNDYPPKSRFAAYELLEEENSGYERDVQTFWLAVLTLATNQLPTSSFQAERLYRLELDISKRGMARMLNEHISTLVAVRDNLKHRLHGTRKVYSMDVEDLLSPVQVLVPFSDVGGTELEISTASVGLASDRPRDESAWWLGKTKSLEDGAVSFMRKPKRALSRAVQDARNQATLSDKSPRVLDEIEKDELSEQLDGRLEKLLVPATAGILDQKKFRSVIDDNSRAVRAHIKERAATSAILTALGAAFAVWIVVLAPYLFVSSRAGMTSLKDSGIVAFLVLLTLGLLTLGALYLMRRNLLGMVGAMNSAVLSQVIQVKTGGERFTEYLSDAATYARGRAVLKGTERAQEQEKAQNRELQLLLRRVTDAIDQEKEVVQSSGTGLAVTPNTAFLAHFDPANSRQANNLFRYPVTPRSIPFGSTGEHIEAPYDFIEQMSLEHMSLFEKVAARTDPTVEALVDVTEAQDAAGEPPGDSAGVDAGLLAQETR